MPTKPGQMTSGDLGLLRPTSIVVDAPPESSPDDPVTAPTNRKMLSSSKPKLFPGALKGVVPALSGRSSSGGMGGRSRGGSMLVGLDIQPGYVTAVQARVNGSILVQRAAGASLPADTIREGEVLDGNAVSETLREMFREARLDKRVRVGVANQRTVLRTLELPPITDRKELVTAVRFQAEDQVPMPLENAVLDFHALGVIDTPAGPRQRVIVVAAQRDMVEHLLAAVRGAGLRPDGIDLSAFALIRSLHRADEEHAGRVLYLNVGGLTNMAIAEGTLCRFTRVIGGGLESMAADIAERHGIKLQEARELLASVDLEAPAQAAQLDAEPSSEPVERPRIDVRPVLAGGVREIAGEVRNSLDFHRSQDDGGEVSSVVLSGPALQISGFASALQNELRVPVVPQTVGLLEEDSAGLVSAERLAVAAGLTVEEAPR
ncbi:MAG TPA: type IV pilus assembly protein PilM [Solirubrobacteraceae bacterium]|nr:type IV pilus assembly protein PilM [Solirubrobacteraceae bacterium]